MSWFVSRRVIFGSFFFFTGLLMFLGPAEILGATTVALGQAALYETVCAMEPGGGQL